MTRSPGHGRGIQVRWYLTVSGLRRSAPARPEGYVWCGSSLRRESTLRHASMRRMTDRAQKQTGNSEQTVEYYLRLYHNSY